MAGKALTNCRGNGAVVCISSLLLSGTCQMEALLVTSRLPLPCPRPAGQDQTLPSRLESGSTTTSVQVNGDRTISCYGDCLPCEMKHQRLVRASTCILYYLRNSKGSFHSATMSGLVLALYCIYLNT